MYPVVSAPAFPLASWNSDHTRFHLLIKHTGFAYENLCHHALQRERPVADRLVKYLDSRFPDWSQVFGERFGRPLTDKMKADCVKTTSSKLLRWPMTTPLAAPYQDLLWKLAFSENQLKVAQLEAMVSEYYGNQVKHDRNVGTVYVAELLGTNLVKIGGCTRHVNKDAKRFLDVEEHWGKLYGCRVNISHWMDIAGDKGVLWQAIERGAHALLRSQHEHGEVFRAKLSEAEQAIRSVTESLTASSGDRYAWR